MTRLVGAASFLTWALDTAIERAFFVEENATYSRRSTRPAAGRAPSHPVHPSAGCEGHQP